MSSRVLASIARRAAHGAGTRGCRSSAGSRGGRTGTRMALHCFARGLVLLEQVQHARPAGALRRVLARVVEQEHAGTLPGMP
jgi:hypothetical protein